MTSTFLKGLSFAACILLVGQPDLAPVAWAATPQTAFEWRRWEGRLTCMKQHAQPYEDLEVDVQFQGPQGQTFTVPAFWDGDGIFRFRAAFPAVGVWTWRSTCNDTAETGLHDQQGEVRVEEYVHARARQRFSVIQIVATGTVARNSTQSPASGHVPFDDDGTPNPPFWRDMDEKIAAANDQGLLVMLTGLGNSPAGFAEQQDSQAFARYIAGRLAGHMVIFSPSMDQKIDRQNDDTGARLKALTTHLIAQHPGTDFDAVQHYHDAKYTDLSTLQSGHRGGRIELAYEGARAWTYELWNRPPVKPVINIETMYDAHGHNNAPNWREQDVRKLGWVTWLSGSRGYTYGAGDVPPKVPGANGGVWRFNTDPETYDYWRKALFWPRATQMTRLRDFFASLDWWRLEPTPQLVLNQAEEQIRKMVASRTPQGDLLLAYLPDNDQIELDLTEISPEVQASWFNPVTGDTQAAEIPALPSSNAAFHRPPGWDDAILLLKRP